MAAFLALASAALYGAADFIGGLAARQAATVAIVILSQASGFVLLALALPVLPAASPAPRDLAWGALAGLSTGIGVALLYRALAVGTMAVVAPVTAVCAVLVPVAADLLTGHWPRGTTLAGIGVALISIVLISQATTPAAADGNRGAARRVMGEPGFGLALLAGVAVGVFFLALARTAPAAGLWPLLAARGASVVLFVVIAAVRSVPIALPVRLAWWVAAGGAVDMVANGLYLLATRRGSLSVVVTLASLYPASTVLLARVFLGERLSPMQNAGIVAAFLAVVMIVAGEL
jgi:drug/metabolite transporter (DMT)-like permease